MSSLLRVLQMFAIVFWVGGLLFFAFLLAPTAFHVLPVRQAGMVVGAVLRRFHPVGLVCGGLFLTATALLVSRATGSLRRRYGIQLLLAGVMVLLTGYLQTKVLPAMERDQISAGGDVNAVSLSDPARMDFDRLHIQSERVESVVLLCGLALVVLLALEAKSKRTA